MKRIYHSKRNCVELTAAFEALACLVEEEEEDNNPFKVTTANDARYNISWRRQLELHRQEPQ